MNKRKRNKSLIIRKYRTREHLVGINAIIVLVLSINLMYGQQDESQSKFQWLDLSGFVANSVKYDSRQSVTAREGELFLYPKPIDKDEYGNDRNDFGKLQMFNLHSRMRWKITGPDFFNYKTTAVLSWDFFGTTNGNIATARLRHAFINLVSEKTEFLFGQTWHPTFATECYPEIIAWGAAVPMQPFNRSPQIRFTYKPKGDLKMQVSLLSQRDFANSGPNGTSGEYLRNSGIPELQASVIGKLGKTVTAGIIGGYKTIVPRLETDSLIAHKETISSYNVSGFVKLKTRKYFIKLHTIYGQNLSNLLLLGGYGVDEVVDAGNDYRTYKNFHVFSTWTETGYKFNNLSIGFFAGYVSAPDHAEIENSHYYGLGNNIASLYRWSPRMVYQKDNLKFGLEVAATTANYLEHEVSGRIIEKHSVTAYRYIFTTLLYF